MMLVLSAAGCLHGCGMSQNIEDTKLCGDAVMLQVHLHGAAQVICAAA